MDGKSEADERAIASFRARRVLGIAYRADAIDWAVRLLMDGKDTAGLRLLAGLEPGEESTEVDHYLEQCIVELGLPLVDDTEAIREYTREIARDILNHEISPEGGTKVLCEICSFLGHWDSLVNWLYLEEIRVDLDAPAAPAWMADIDRNQFHELVKREAESVLGLRKDT